MKILIVNTGYLPTPPKSSSSYAGGSIELHVYHLANELARLGAEVYCVTEVAEGEFFEKKVTIIEPKFSPLSARGYLGNLVIFALKGSLTSMEAAKVIAKEHFDVIHGHGSVSFGFLLPFLDGSKTIFTVHNRTPWMLPIFSFKQLIRKLAFSFLDYGILKKANHIIAVSKILKKELIFRWKIPSAKITVIPNGVDLESFKPNIPNSKIIRRKYGINFDYALFVGRLVEEKGIWRIIEAIAGTNLHVVIAGDGPLLPFLRSFSKKVGVSEQIHFIGTVPRNDLPKLYSQATLFILPSLAEGIPMAGLEALASGLPLIVSRGSGMDDAVINGFNGFVVDGVDEIREKMILIFNDASLRRIMSERSRNIAKDNFSWKAVAKQTLRLYEELLSNGHGENG